MKYNYDVAVLGGGPGGYVAAVRCALLGKRTVLIEKDALGGTCLNRGCMPTKSMLHSAQLYREIQGAGDFGITVSNVEFRFDQIMKRKNQVVTRLSGGVGALLKQAGVEVIQGAGTLKNTHTIAVNGQQITAANLILATGSAPSQPPIPGLRGSGALSSDEVLALETCPESLVIIGGGVIGIEFAGIFSMLGKKVTVIEMLPNILGGMDAELSAACAKVLQRQGVEVITNAKVLELKKGLCIYEHGGKKSQVEAEQVIVATGRIPVTAGLGLEAVGVKMQRGFVMVDDTMHTSVLNIYAIGDITGKLQLAHVASAQGLVAAANIAGKDDVMQYDVIPSCVYTSPEIAAVGLTEEQAREKGYRYKVGRFSVSHNGKATVMGESTGFVKLITQEDTGELLGAHIMAPRATDIIAELCVLKRSEGTIDELARTIHPHPTVSEMVMEAAHDVEGMSSHAPRRVL